MIFFWSVLISGLSLFAGSGLALGAALGGLTRKWAGSAGSLLAPPQPFARVRYSFVEGQPGDRRLGASSRPSLC